MKTSRLARALQAATPPEAPSAYRVVLYLLGVTVVAFTTIILEEMLRKTSLPPGTVAGLYYFWFFLFSGALYTRIMSRHQNWRWIRPLMTAVVGGLIMGWLFTYLATH
jgi:uncharacterized membrane protein YgdD (TMEM256/DUF423 family)